MACHIARMTHFAKSMDYDNSPKADDGEQCKRKGGGFILWEKQNFLQKGEAVETNRKKQAAEDAYCKPCKAMFENDSLHSWLLIKIRRGTEND